MKAFLACVALALLVVSPATAHVSVRPALFVTGEETLLRIELSGLRLGAEATALEVSGPGVRELSSVRSGRLGDESRWRVRVQVDSEPGPLPLLLRARYADGRSVLVHQTLTVLPARAEDASSAPVVALSIGLVGLVAAASAIVLRRRQRTRT